MINCIGKTQEEITAQYGPIVSGNESLGYTHSSFPKSAYVGYIYSEKDQAMICYCAGITVGGLISDFDKISIDNNVWRENKQELEDSYIEFNLQDGLSGYIHQRAKEYIQSVDDIYVRQ